MAACPVRKSEATPGTGGGLQVPLSVPGPVQDRMRKTKLCGLRRDKGDFIGRPCPQAMIHGDNPQPARFNHARGQMHHRHGIATT